MNETSEVPYTAKAGDEVSCNLTANLYDICRHRNQRKKQEKAAVKQKRRFSMSGFEVPALTSRCRQNKPAKYKSTVQQSQSTVTN